MTFSGSRVPVALMLAVSEPRSAVTVLKVTWLEACAFQYQKPTPPPTRATRTSKLMNFLMRVTSRVSFSPKKHQEGSVIFVHRARRRPGGNTFRITPALTELCDLFLAEEHPLQMPAELGQQALKLSPLGLIQAPQDGIDLVLMHFQDPFHELPALGGQ